MVDERLEERRLAGSGRANEELRSALPQARQAPLSSRCARSPRGSVARRRFFQPRIELLAPVDVEIVADAREASVTALLIIRAVSLSRWS